MSHRTESVVVWLSQLFLVGAFLGAWQMASRLGWADPDTLPPLSSVIATLWQMLHQAAFKADLRTTGAEVAISFLITAPLGLLLGFYIGERPTLERATRAPLDMLMATPKALLLPLFIFAFGIGFSEKVFFAMSLGVFVLILAGISAVQSIPRGLTVAVSSMGASKWQLYSRVYLPGMIPLILNGLRVCLIFTIFGVLLAEMYASATGVGRVIYDAGQAYQLKDMLAGVLLIMCVSMILNEALRQCERAVLKRRGAAS